MMYLLRKMSQRSIFPIQIFKNKQNKHFLNKYTIRIYIFIIVTSSQHFVYVALIKKQITNALVLYKLENNNYNKITHKQNYIKVSFLPLTLLGSEPGSSEKAAMRNSVQSHSTKYFQVVKYLRIPACGIIDKHNISLVKANCTTQYQND